MGILKTVATAPFKLIKKGVEKGVEKAKGVEENKELKEDFIADMTFFLSNWGFDVKDAVKIAEEVYQKHKDKLMEAT